MAIELLKIWDSIWIGLLGSSTLLGIYRVVERQWPEKYLGITDTFGLSGQESLGRFLGYRAVPTFVISTTTIVTVERLGGWPILSACVLYISAIIVPHSVALWQNVTRKSGKVNYASYHFGMICWLGLTVLIGWFLRGSWATLVPTPSELLSGLWSGIVVAGAGGMVVASIRKRNGRNARSGPAYFVDRAGRDVGIDLMDWLHDECVRTGADPLLLKAILINEAVQRPRWLRLCERFASRMGFAATTGVMQLASGSRTLSDRESVTIACERYSCESVLTPKADGSGQWSVDKGSAWAALGRHNGDIDFIETCFELMEYLYEIRVAGDLAPGEIGPILEMRRMPEEFILRGITNANKFYIDDGLSGVIEVAQRVKGAGPWAWQVEIPPQAKHLVMWEPKSDQSKTFEVFDARFLIVK